MSVATLRQYNQSILSFKLFLLNSKNLSLTLPANPGHVALFVTFLFHSGLSASTIRSKLSAISFIHRLFSVPDPAVHIIVSKVMTGVNRLVPASDARIPVSLAILEKMILTLPKLHLSKYLSITFKAIICLAFAAFLRPGEFTKSDNSIQFQDVTFFNNTIIVKFKKFKHSKAPTTLGIRSNSKVYCPVKAMLDYLRIRGSTPGDLFIHPGGNSITKKDFSSLLNLSTSFIGLRGFLTPHSFRIGAATHAAASGLSDEQIRLWGRWNSSSVRSYIRIPALII